jgi:hypothetical protein
MIVAELIGPLEKVEPTKVQRDAIEECISEAHRYCYERIALRDSSPVHDIEVVQLQYGKNIPLLMRCNGVTVAKIYNEAVGYVVDFSAE